MNTFEKTLGFNEKMRKPAHKIIKSIFDEYYQDQFKVEKLNSLELDKEASIDSKVESLTTKVNFSIQEKYRTNDKLVFGDFTQELYNDFGGENQTDGEFKHLWADFYFYGWTNKAETDFVSFFVMDIKEYKQLVQRAGGLSKLPGAASQVNAAYGKALFYSIPLPTLKPAMFAWSQSLDHIFK
ncbi:MAG: hypothetical protein GY734_21840 [Herbaspirillum sp.]|uniref:hypothetical protein n=1 Tax=Burkholderiales TaxID=80840 RepID=UPI001E33FDE3|nr:MULTISPECIES: hypothetical protein [Burkholderiales]MCD0496820.1 hypothetical protein [Achromobacter sp. MY14]MCP3658509.1 hypothetical protein [Herbaspirillum sp.]MCP4033862.1 hypothetical protein [Herbaspirillum sp.]